MKKVLVTGADGQLGKCIQKIEKNYPDFQFIFKNSKQLDITDAKKVELLFKNEELSFCINCAAYTNVDQAEKTPEKAYKINAVGVKNLALSCSTHQVTLIHISTDFVFDGTKDEPYTVNDKPNPINEYGKSKLRGEKYIQEILEEYLIIRTSWLYSESGNNFLKTMLKLGKEKDELNVVANQIGAPTYAGDVAKLIVSIIGKNKTACGLYHYSNEGEASWYDFATAIFDLINFNVKVCPIKSEEYPTFAKRPKYSVMDNTKIKNNLGIKIPHWRESLEQCINSISIDK